MEARMALVKKTIELDQDQINRIRTALKAKSEKEAINAVLKQFVSHPTGYNYQTYSLCVP